MIKAIYNILSNDATLNGLVDGRIYPLIVPQGKPYPAITMQIISNVGDYCKNGLTQDNYRLQVNVFARNDVDMYGIADVVKDTLNGISGTYAGIEIRNIRKLNEGDLWEKDAELYHYYIDFKVTIKLV